MILVITKTRFTESNTDLLNRLKRCESQSCLKRFRHSNTTPLNKGRSRLKYFQIQTLIGWTTLKWIGIRTERFKTLSTTEMVNRRTWTSIMTEPFVDSTLDQMNKRGPNKTLNRREVNRSRDWMIHWFQKKWLTEWKRRDLVMTERFATTWANECRPWLRDSLIQKTKKLAEQHGNESNTDLLSMRQAKLGHDKKNLLNYLKIRWFKQWPSDQKMSDSRSWLKGSLIQTLIHRTNTNASHNWMICWFELWPAEQKGNESRSWLKDSPIQILIR